jgi:hypothetical protein
LKYASEALKSDKEIVMAAIKQNFEAFDYSSIALKSDKEFVLTAVKHNWNAFKYVSKSLQSNKEILLAAANQNLYALYFAPADVRLQLMNEFIIPNNVGKLMKDNF